MRYKRLKYSGILLLVLFAGISLLLWASARNARPIKIDAETIEIHDYSFLKARLENASIVILGETLHDDGTTFEQKTEIVKFLHDSLGFNTLLLEAELYGMKDFDASAPEKTLWPFWASSEQMHDLWAYIRNSDLEVGGIDCQFSGNIPDSLRFERIMSLADGAKGDYPVSRKKMRRIIRRVSSGSDLRYTISRDTLEAINREMRQMTDSMPDGYSKRMIDGFRNVINYQYTYKLGDDRRVAWRDSLMFDNFKWHKEHTENKIIVWCSNMHASKKYYRNCLTGKEYANFGQRVKERYGDSLYVILFDNWGRIAEDSERPYYLPKTSSLEYGLHHIGSSKPLFVTGLDLLGKVNVSRLFEAELLCSPAEMADAIIFIDLMENVIYENMGAN